MSQRTYSNDEYTCEIEQLGYEKQAEIIRDVIIGCDTPYGLGIPGRWGSGKTSMMKYNHTHCCFCKS